MGLLHLGGGISVPSGLVLKSELIGSALHKIINGQMGFEGLPTL